MTIVHEPSTSLLELNEFNAKELYDEYIDGYNKLHKYVNSLRKIKAKDKKTMDYKKIVYDVEREIIENLIMIERYLPQKDRFFTNKRDNEIRKMTLNKTSNVGFIYNDKVSKNIDKELTRKELIKLIKSLLTEKQFECFYMYYFEGKTQEEIGKELKMTKSTVNVHIKNSILTVKNIAKKSNYFIDLLTN